MRSSRSVGVCCFVVLLVLLTCCVSTTAATTTASAKFGTATIMESLPFSTGRLGFWNNPLHSFVSGRQQDVYIIQHFENASNYEETMATLVLQGFNTTTRKALYVKRFRCQGMSNYNGRRSQQRVFEINDTHAVVLCSSANPSTGTVPRVMAFNVETGAVDWSVASVLSEGDTLDVTSIDRTRHLFALSNSYVVYILNVTNRSLSRFNNHDNIYYELDTPKIFVESMSSYICVGSTLVALEYPSMKAIWKQSEDLSIVAIAPELVALTSQLGLGNKSRVSTDDVVPVVTQNTTAYALELFNAKNGSLIGSIPFGHLVLPVQRSDKGEKNVVDVEYQSLSLSKSFQTKTETETVLILHVESLLFSVETPSSSSSSGDSESDFHEFITCGVIAFNLETLSIAWSEGFDVHPHNDDYGTSGGYRCEWFTPSSPSSSSSFSSPDASYSNSTTIPLGLGWLVRPSLTHLNQPLVSVVNMSNGRTVAVAGGSSSISSPPSASDHHHVPHLALPAAAGNNYATESTWPISATLFDDVLLLRYPLSSEATDDSDAHPFLVGIRLVANMSRSSSIGFRFEKNFEVDISKCKDYRKNSNYGLKPWLAQRVDNNTLLVPMYNLFYAYSSLLWVNITDLHYSTTPSHSDLTYILVGTAGGVVLLIILTYVIMKIRYNLRRYREGAGAEGEGEYEALPEDGEHTTN